MKDHFSERIREITKIYSSFSAADIASSLFVSSIWLPNISSQVKHQLLYEIFLSLPSNHFKEKESITEYLHFENLMKDLYQSLPSFTSLEDYIPELDWGEVKYHYENNSYKILYGCELANIYEFHTLLELILTSYSSTLENSTSRSPIEEFILCLQLQDFLISKLSRQEKPNNIKITPGYTGVPSKDFWENALDFLIEFNSRYCITNKHLEHYICQLDCINPSCLTEEKFHQSINYGYHFNKLVLIIGNKLYPIHPRRTFPIVFETWGKLLNSLQKGIIREDTNDINNFLNSVIRYVGTRMPSKSVFPIVSALKDDKPDDFVCPLMIRSANKLIFVYFLSPITGNGLNGEDIKTISNKINLTKKILNSTTPRRIVLHTERKCISFSNDTDLELMSIIVFPDISTELAYITLPNDSTSLPMFLSQFLGIMDELDELNDLSEFLDFLNHYTGKINPFNSSLDQFAAFKKFDGVITIGNKEPDHVTLDTNWGTNYRYDSLKKFWNLFPMRGFINHPRTWKIENIPTNNSIMLISKSHSDYTYYIKIGDKDVFITSLSEGVECEQARLAFNFVNLIKDSFDLYCESLVKNSIDNLPSQIRIAISPKSLSRSSYIYQSMKNLICKDGEWNMELKYHNDICVIKIVYSEDFLIKNLLNATDRSFQVEIFLAILNLLNSKFPIGGFSGLCAKIEQTKIKKPRIILSMEQQKVSFPQHSTVILPSNFHYKKAKIIIAKLLDKQDIIPGVYKNDDAKYILNKIRTLINDELDKRISKLNYSSSIKFLVTQLDSLVNKYEMDDMKFELAAKSDVDYDLGSIAGKTLSDYITNHKNIRYLIEKFVLNSSSGKDKLNDEEYKLLFSLVDELYVVHLASDSIHHNIDNVVLSINEDFVTEIQYESDMETKELEYASEHENIYLGITGRVDDQIVFNKLSPQYLDKIDEAFQLDYGWRWLHLLGVLKTLSSWGFKDNENIATFYEATSIDIAKHYSTFIKGKKPPLEEIIKVIDFLTLKKDKLLYISGKDKPENEIPIWEYRKRPHKLILRPLIQIDEKLIWGSYSAQKAGIIWTNIAINHRLPIDLEAKNVTSCIKQLKEERSKELVKKTVEIIRRYTKNIKVNCKLHKLKKMANHPIDLGDYDVIGYYSEKNTIINIECKEVYPPYSFAEAGRLKKKLFDQPKNEVSKFERRIYYLKENLIKICMDTKWPIDTKNPPKVISIFVSSYSYWWTKFPPRAVDMKFVQIQMLDDFLSDL